MLKKTYVKVRLKMFKIHAWHNNVDNLSFSLTRTGRSLMLNIRHVCSIQNMLSGYNITIIRHKHLGGFIVLFENEFGNFIELFQYLTCVSYLEYFH